MPPPVVQTSTGAGHGGRQRQDAMKSPALEGRLECKTHDAAGGERVRTPSDLSFDTSKRARWTLTAWLQARRFVAVPLTPTKTPSRCSSHGRLAAHWACHRIWRMAHASAVVAIEARTVMGMLNNPIYRIKIHRERGMLWFEHPTQGSMPGGWMTEDAGT